MIDSEKRPVSFRPDHFSHIALITKDSIILFGQQPAWFKNFIATISSRLLYTELPSIGTSGYDLIGN